MVFPRLTCSHTSKCVQCRPAKAMVLSSFLTARLLLSCWSCSICRRCHCDPRVWSRLHVPFQLGVLSQTESRYQKRIEPGHYFLSVRGVAPKRRIDYSIQICGAKPPRLVVYVADWGAWPHGNLKLSLSGLRGPSISITGTNINNDSDPLVPVV